MSIIVALVHSDLEIPPGVFEKIRDLQAQGQLQVSEARLVVRAESGKVQLQSGRPLPLMTSLDATFLGTLVGLMFFTSALKTWQGTDHHVFDDLGVDQGFAAELMKSLRPGGSALFLHLQNEEIPQAVRDLSSLNLRVLVTSLSSLQEEKLQELFRGEVFTPEIRS